jgi:hypothetical protein
MKWYEMSWNKQRRKRLIANIRQNLSCSDLKYMMVPLHCDNTTKYIAINCDKRVFLL